MKNEKQQFILSKLWENIRNLEKIGVWVANDWLSALFKPELHLTNTIIIVDGDCQTLIQTYI